MSLEPGNLFAVKDLKFDHTNRRRVHLMGYGWLTVYRYKSENDDDASYFTGTEQPMATYEVKKYKDIAYQIEKCHRTLKQDCHMQRYQVRIAKKQLNHIGLSIRSYVRLAHQAYVNRISTQQIKFSIWKTAATQYLSAPFCRLPPTA
jgi:hypothetical protein